MAMLLFFAAVATVLFALCTTPSKAQDSNCNNLDFGQCSNPSIQFGYNFSGSGVWGYETNNQDDFAHAWTLDIATLESFICSQLQSPCNAPSDTLYACRGALQELSTLTGQNAVDSWNNALGLSGSDSGDCSATTVYAQGYATTVTVTDFVSDSAPTTVTVTALTGSTSAYTTSSSSSSSSSDSESSSSSTVSSGATLTVTITESSSTTNTQGGGSVAKTVTVTEGSPTTGTTGTSGASSGSTGSANSQHSESSSQASSTSSASSTSTSTETGLGNQSPFNNAAAPASALSQILAPIFGILAFLVAS